MTNIITNAIITAYCACQVCCGHAAKGLTASGQKPQEGVTVAASRVYPLGSTLHYNGHTYIIQDRLAKRYDNRVDVYFNSHLKAKQFGIKTNQTLTIITK